MLRVVQNVKYICNLINLLFKLYGNMVSYVLRTKKILGQNFTLLKMFSIISVQTDLGYCCATFQPQFVWSLGSKFGENSTNLKFPRKKYYSQLIIVSGHISLYVIQTGNTCLYENNSFLFKIERNMFLGKPKADPRPPHVYFHAYFCYFLKAFFSNCSRIYAF